MFKDHTAIVEDVKDNTITFITVKDQIVTETEDTTDLLGYVKLQKKEEPAQTTEETPVVQESAEEAKGAVAVEEVTLQPDVVSNEVTNTPVTNVKADAQPTDTAKTETSVKKSALQKKLEEIFRANTTNEATATDSGVDLSNYLTGFTAYHKENGQWKPATTFADGEDATFSLNFTIPSGTLTADQKTLTYSLGPNVVLPDEGQSGKVTQNGKEVGDYTITKDGQVTITLNDAYDTTTAFEGTLTFEGTVKNTGGSSGSDVHFGTSDTIHIKPKPKDTDLTAEKTAYLGSDGLIHYTINLTTYKGTAGPINVWDAMSGLNSIQAGDITNWSVTYNGKTTGPQGEDLTQIQPNLHTAVNNNDDNGWSVTLPQVEKDPSPYYGRYTISYTVKPDARTDANGHEAVGNNVNADDGTNKPHAYTYTEIQKTLVTKTASRDDTNKKINWTVTINNPDHHDMSKDTFKDILKVDDATGTYPSTVHIRGTDGREADITVNSDGSFTLPGTGWNDGTYKITYSTDYPTGPVGTQKGVSNTFEYTHNGQTYTDSHNEWTPGTEKTYNVQKWDATVTSSDENSATLNWWAKINLPDGTISKDSIEFTDTLTKDNGVHYTTPKLLQDMYLYPTKQDNTSAATLVKGTDYRVYMEDGTTDITDSESTDQITGFKIKFTDSGVAKVKGMQCININYSSITDYSNQDYKTTWSYKNTGSIPGHSDDGKWDHTKEQVISKLSAPVGPGFYNYGNGNYNYKDTGITVEKKDGIIYYAVIVRVPEGTSGDMTLTDTLPAGLSYKSGSATIAIYTKSDDATRNYSDGKGVLGVTVNDPETQADGTSKVKFNVTGYRPGEAFVLYYQAEVQDEDFWNVQTNTDKDYTNKIEWNTYYDSTTTHVEQNKQVIEKEGAASKNDDGTYDLTYHLKVNATAADLDTNSDQLVLTDTLSIPNDSDAKAYFDPSTIKVYNYDPTMPYGMGSEISNSRYMYQYDEKTHKITITIPDQLACVITYKYRATVGLNDTTISNTAQLTGVANSSTTNGQKLTGSTSSATTKQNKLTLYKVDSNDDKIKLSGVTFKLEKYVGKPNGTEVWEPITFKDNKGVTHGDTKTTDENGEISFTTIDDGLQTNTLYRIVEKDVGNNPGYVLNTTPSYFIWKDKLNYTNNGNTVTKDNPNINDEWDYLNTLPGGSPNNPQRDKVYLVDSMGSVNYPNVKNAITVNKVWLNADNKDLNDPTKTATVQLWRKYTHTETIQGDTVNVTVILKDGNTGKEKTETVQINKNDSRAEIYVVGDYWNSFTADDGTTLEKKSYKGGNAFPCYPIGSTSEDKTITLTGTGASGDWWENQVSVGVDQSAAQTVDVPEDERAIDANGNEYPEITLDSSTNWSNVWTGLPADDGKGNTYYYYVKEVKVDGSANNLSNYDTTITNNGGIDKGTITITNKSKTQVQHASFNFTKKWVDKNGNSQDWQKDIVVILTGTASNSSITSRFTIHWDGNTLTATNNDPGASDAIKTYSFAGSKNGDGYQLKFSDLPYADANGIAYTYTLTEDKVEGYKTEYYDANGDPIEREASITSGQVINNVEQGGYVLPDTGGIGTKWFTGCGAFLIGIALILWIKQRNEERRKLKGG